MKVTDLDFNIHPIGTGLQAIAEFDNGFSASVVVGKLFYSRIDAPYEIAVLENGIITYDTPITDDVLGYLTEDEANDVLAQIEALPKSSGKGEENN